MTRWDFNRAESRHGRVSPTQSSSHILPGWTPEEGQSRQVSQAGVGQRRAECGRGLPWGGENRGCRGSREYQDPVSRPWSVCHLLCATCHWVPKTWEERAAEASAGLAAGLLLGACLAGPSVSLTGLTPAATVSSGYWVCAALRI